MRIILVILLLCPAAFGQVGQSQIDDWAIDSLLADSAGWQGILQDAWVGQDNPKPKCPDLIEIFYIDTVSWYLDTIVVEIPCPTSKYQEEGGYAGCLVMHTGLKIVWKPKIETKSIFKFEPSTFEHFERWRIRKQ